MSRYIALLRGINVGGNKKIKMAELRALCESLGFTGIKTLLQSGNVIFESAESDPGTLTGQIEDAIQARFGFESRVIMRTPDEWREVVTRHPFTDEQLDDPRKIQVVFMTHAPESIDALTEAYSGDEIIHHLGRELYIFYTNGMGRSKLDNKRIERHLQTTSTGRNWNTVTKILALVAD